MDIKRRRRHCEWELERNRQGWGERTEREETGRAGEKKKSEIKSERRKRRGILKDRERRVSRESHMLKQKGAEAAFILPNTCGFNATQRFFCCCSTRQRFTPMRKAAVTSSQLTESLSGGDKGLESSWWSQALGGGGRGVYVHLCVLCVLPRVCTFVGT